MLSISLFAEIIRGNRVAINISPFCGDDSVHTLQRTNRRTFEAKPYPNHIFCVSVDLCDSVVSFVVVVTPRAGKSALSALAKPFGFSVHVVNGL